MLGRTLKSLRVVGLCLGLAWTVAPARAEPEYHFSPVNQSGIATVAAYWNPIVGYVSQKSGVKLSLKVGRTSADTTAYVLAQEVDFAFTNHLFSPERDQLGWKVLARRNTPALHGQIVVPADSPINDIAQLKGLDVGFPGPEAFIAYKTTYAEILRRKVDVKVVFGGNMDGAFAQLFSGKVAAVGANSQLVEGYTKREGKRFKVLWSSEGFHDLALMVSSRVPEKEAQAVAKAFVDMAKDPVGRDILATSGKVVGLAADAVFVPADGNDYASYRRFFQSAPPQLR
jgi:phosphonate transport system substrate-binding protein